MSQDDGRGNSSEISLRLFLARNKITQRQTPRYLFVREYKISIVGLRLATIKL